MWLLLGCLGSMVSSEGRERVHSALWFAGRESALNGGEGGPDTPFLTLVLVSNSVLPCEAEDIEDDPQTGLSEPGAARQYWEGQVLTAFTREGAMLSLLGLYTWNPDLSGDYTIYNDGLEAHAARLEAEARVGFGAWMRVNEASLEASSGLLNTYTVTELDFAIAGGGSTAALAVLGVEEDETDIKHGERLRGEFALQPTGVRGDFLAERCRNDDLYDAVVAQVVALQYR